MTVRAILIDAKAGEVREVELPDSDVARVAAMNAAIGGFLEVAFMWPSGDVLYCDEDYLRHDWPFGFVFLPRFEATRDGVLFPRELLGNGVVVGREVEYPDDWTQLDPVITVDELRKLVSFFRR